MFSRLGRGPRRGRTFGRAGPDRPSPLLDRGPCKPLPVALPRPGRPRPGGPQGRRIQGRRRRGRADLLHFSGNLPSRGGRGPQPDRGGPSPDPGWNAEAGAGWTDDSQGPAPRLPGPCALLRLHARPGGRRRAGDRGGARWTLSASAPFPRGWSRDPRTDPWGGPGQGGERGIWQPPCRRPRREPRGPGRRAPGLARLHPV